MEHGSSIGWLSVLPPLLTIFIAVVFQRVVLALAAGILSALLIVQSSRVDVAADTSWMSRVGSFLSELFVEHLGGSLVDWDHLRVFGFSVLLSIQIAIIEQSGGMAGLVASLQRYATGRRSGQLLTWVLGMLIFIDDYANTLLLGSTMRPLTDRLKISREKLAFIVDSTSAPVAGLAVVSTWVATEISAMQSGFETIGYELPNGTFYLFLQTMPYRFYLWFCIAFVFWNAWSNRDFGPMYRAEMKAQEATEPPSAEPSNQSFHPSTVSHQGLARTAILPVLLTVAVTMLVLYLTGRATMVERGEVPSLATIEAAGRLVGDGDSYTALLWGAGAGTLLASLFSVMQGHRVSHLLRAVRTGSKHMAPALLILWLAWSLSRLTGGDFLQTGEFVSQQFVRWNVSVEFYPTLVFLLAAVIAFSTGTSWGTMAILMPIAISIVSQTLVDGVGMSMAEVASHPIMIGSIGGVLAGSIFGDHCSPISDTTILSARSSSCDQVQHVRTQLPYALAVAGISILFGTLPAGFGVSAMWLLPIGVAATGLLLLLVGKVVIAGKSHSI